MRRQGLAGRPAGLRVCRHPRPARLPVLRRNGPGRTRPGYQSGVPARSDARPAARRRRPAPARGPVHSPRPMGRRSPRTRPPGHLGGLSSMAEHRIVAPKVAGSSPVGHPNSSPPDREGPVTQDRRVSIIGLGYVGPSPRDRVRRGRPRGRGRGRVAGPCRRAQRPPLPHRRRQRRAPGGGPRRRPARGRARRTHARVTSTRCSCASRRRSRPPRTPTSGQCSPRRRSCATGSGPGTSSCSSRPPSRARPPARSARSSRQSGLDARARTSTSPSRPSG